MLALVIGTIAGGMGGYLVTEYLRDDAYTLLDRAPVRDTSDAPKGSTEWVADQMLPSVVQVQVSTPNGFTAGSGFIITPSGYIMTNNHVIAAAVNGLGKIVVKFHDGRDSPASIVGRDPSTDIAVLKVEVLRSLNLAELGRSANVQVGQSVVAIGSPFGLSGTVTSGVLSALHRPVTVGESREGLEPVLDAIQTDAPINLGNSGGPLVNKRGEVIGVNSAIYAPAASQASGSLPTNTGIGFAIPIDQARRTAEKIINTGHATQTFIGATVTNAKNGGVLITEVFSDSPAEEAGLQKGDVVTKIGSRRTDTAITLIATIRTKAPGTTVTLTLKGGRTVDVTLGGKPVEVD